MVRSSPEDLVRWVLVPVWDPVLALEWDLDPDLAWRLDRALP